MVLAKTKAYWYFHLQNSLLFPKSGLENGCFPKYYCAVQLINHFFKIVTIPWTAKLENYPWWCFQRQLLFTLIKLLRKVFVFMPKTLGSKVLNLDFLEVTPFCFQHVELLCPHTSTDERECSGEWGLQVFFLIKKAMLHIPQDHPARFSSTETSHMHIKITINPPKQAWVHKAVGKYLGLFWNISWKCFQGLLGRPYLCDSATDNIPTVGMVFSGVTLVHYLTRIMSLQQILNRLTSQILVTWNQLQHTVSDNLQQGHRVYYSLNLMGERV